MDGWRLHSHFFWAAGFRAEYKNALARPNPQVSAFLSYFTTNTRIPHCLLVLICLPLRWIALTSALLTVHLDPKIFRQEPLPSLTMSAEQAAAQAAAAAANTPQQQPQGTPQQSAATPASVVNSSGDQLVCQWQTCGERLPSAEQLYVSIPSLSQDDELLFSNAVSSFSRS
jgi:hypothetical protein